MDKKTWVLILKAPALLLLIVSFLTGLYAAYAGIQDMGWEVPIILFIVLFLYFIGSRLEMKSDKIKLNTKEIETFEPPEKTKEIKKWFK